MRNAIQVRTAHNAKINLKLIKTIQASACARVDQREPPLMSLLIIVLAKLAITSHKATVKSVMKSYKIARSAKEAILWERM